MSNSKTNKKSGSRAAARVSLEKVREIARDRFGIVGRASELELLWTAVSAGRNVLVEGPVGVGKTALAQAVAGALGRDVVRVDGDSRFTEQKLTGWFDPSLVLKKGYGEKTFAPGPLVKAMREGSVLFINELNRMPEAVQNVLLPAIDEGFVQVPQLGQVRAATGFLVIATQNPKEFVATSHLSEALMDRMEWVRLDYQDFEDERKIAAAASGFEREPFLSRAVAVVRLTRSHPKIKRGASVRAAIAVLKMLDGKTAFGEIGDAEFLECIRLALPTRIELNTSEFEGGYDAQLEAILTDIVEEVKKKPPMSSATPPL